MRKWLVLVLAIVALLALPPQWYPRAWRAQWADWFGASDFRALPESLPPEALDSEPACLADRPDWRNAQTIEGVDIAASPTCIADDPNAVAAFVRGTNNVSAQTLAASGLTSDAVEKGRDLDGDGDPDEIHIRLEIVELNGGSPELPEPATQYAIAPGIRPGFWAFAPKYVGMATESFESLNARAALRLPSPAIRVEQGDIVRVTLENGHYMPHTLHLHGVDHPFVDVTGEGNDGVPITSELPVMPGASRTYEVQTARARNGVLPLPRPTARARDDGPAGAFRRRGEQARQLGADAERRRGSRSRAGARRARRLRSRVRPALRRRRPGPERSRSAVERSAPDHAIDASRVRHHRCIDRLLSCSTAARFRTRFATR